MMRSRKLLLVGTVGLLVGLGRASWSGLKSSSRTGACGGCHAMAPQHASWKIGSHAKVAVCEDCHVPHGLSLGRTQAVAGDGLRHGALTALGFTPSVIRLRGAGAVVVQANCLRCHPRATPNLLSGGGAPKTPRIIPQPLTAPHADPGRACSDCHRETSHARGFAG